MASTSSDEDVDVHSDRSEAYDIEDVVMEDATAERTLIDRIISATSNASTSSTDADTTTFPDGEWQVLMEGLDEPSLPLPKAMTKAMSRSLSDTLCRASGEGVYGHPLSVDEATKRMPFGDNGLVWTATVVPRTYFINGKLKSGLNKRDFNVEEQKIKTRRPSLPLTTTDLLSSLTKIDGPQGPRYIFHGVLNGWPALRCLELIRVEKRRKIPTPKELLKRQVLWSTTWRAEKEGAKGVAPSFAEERLHRIKLRAAPWSSRGWSPSSLGFCFWFEAQHPEGPKLSYGTDMLGTLDDQAECTHIHMLSHRYANLRESTRDRLTYHSICLLEWNHGQYCTVVECAFLNGMGGYKGKSNWYRDRDENVTGLYEVLPPEMVLPWRMKYAELRCYDVEAKTLDEFKAYVTEFGGSRGRFIDPRWSFSHAARLSFRSKRHIAQYLINYIGRDSTYAELKRNCQTFTSDLCSFVAGKKNVLPFHPVSRVEYINRTHLFLYDSHMYASREEKKKKPSKKKKNSTVEP